MKSKFYNEYKLWLLLFGLMGTLSSCSLTPEEKVKKYIECTFLNADGAKAYKLLSSEDQKYTSEKEFETEIKRKNVFNDKFLRKYREHFNYEILETKYVNEDTVKIKVQLTKPNTSNLVQEMITLAMATSVNKISDNQKKEIMEEHFGKLMKSDAIELETEEKEFILVKENEEYKIFLNLGYPYKMELLNHRIEELEKDAKEKIRRIDFEGALKVYDEIHKLKPSEELGFRTSEIKEVLNHTVKLGEEIKTGNLIIRPTKIEMKKIKIEKKNWLDRNPLIVESTEPYFVMTFNVKNNCEGEVFEIFESNRFKKKNVVYDNFGNEMKEFQLDYDMISVEGNQMKQICPGEARQYRAICEPALSPRASKFVWKMRLFTDNKKTEDNIYISFNRDEIVNR